MELTKTNATLPVEDAGFENLVDRIITLVSKSKATLLRQIDDTLVITNWHIGEYIVEFEQYGNARATYGEGLLRSLSKRLTLQLGKGYSRSNLQNMRRLYLYYPKCQTVSGKLSWSHWCELLELDDSLERQFYENECMAQKWGVRTLRRQIDSGLFMRIAQSHDKKGVLELAEKGQIIRTPQDVVKDTFVLEFLGIPKEERMQIKKFFICHSSRLSLSLHGRNGAPA